jgi:hypothetical protein
VYGIISGKTVFYKKKKSLIVKTVIFAVRHGETEWNLIEKNPFRFSCGQWRLDTWGEIAHLNDLRALDDNS